MFWVVVCQLYALSKAVEYLFALLLTKKRNRKAPKKKPA